MHTHTHREKSSVIDALHPLAPQLLHLYLDNIVLRSLFCVHPSTGILLRCRLHQTPILPWKASMIVSVIYNLKHLLSRQSLLNFCIDRSVRKIGFVYTSNMDSFPHENQTHHQSCNKSIADPPVGTT